MESPRRGRDSRPVYSNHESSKRDRYSPDRREGRNSNKRDYYDRSRERGSDRDSYNDYRSERSAKHPRMNENYDKRNDRQVRNDEFCSLAISCLPSEISDSEIKEALYHEFRKFGDFGVKVTYLNEHRLAYINFRQEEDARNARHYKCDLTVFDKSVHIEPVYSRSRKRSPSPSEYDSQTRNIPRSKSPFSERPRKRRDNGGPPHRETNEYSQKNYEPQGQERETDFKYPHHLHHISPEDDSTATRTLFIGNLDYNITDGEIRHIFSRYGLIEDIDIKRPPKGMGNAYAFLRYINLDCAHQAKVDMSGKYIGKFQCKIGYGKVSPSNCLWIGGIGPWVSEDDIGREFGHYGRLSRLQWPPGKTFAYIMYDNQDDAAVACTSMRGFSFGGPDRRIRVDFADPIHMEGTYQNIVISENGPSYTTEFRDDTKHKIAEYKNEYKSSGYDNRPSRQKEQKGFDDNHSDGRRKVKDDPDRGQSSDRCHDHDQRNGSPDGKRRRTDSRTDRDVIRNKDGKSLAVAEHVDNLLDLAKCLPVVWSGALVLKNSAFPSRMHLVSGDPVIVDNLMKDDTNVPLLKITQRLRLEVTKLDEVTKKIQFAGPNGHCVLLAMPQPNINEISDSTVQQRPLRNLVTYLKQKEAAGVTNLPHVKRNKDEEGVLHSFPPCQFAHDFLLNRAPNLGKQLSIEDHLLVVVVRGPP